MNRTLIHYAILIGCTYFQSENLEAVPKSSYSYLDKSVREFEKEHSTASVLILESKTGKIEYAYRPEIAISKRLPPGSLIKTLSALVFLKYKDRFRFSPEKKVRCDGKFLLSEDLVPTKADLSVLHIPKDENGKEYLRCSLAQGHGETDLQSALVQSCNVYFLKTASADPGLFYEKLMEEWALGKSTRARLAPYVEPADIGPYADSLVRKTVSSIGEGGLLLTPLKVAQIYSSIWNTGPILSPYWIRGEGPVLVGENRFSDRDLRRITYFLSQVPESGTLKGLKSYRGDPEILGGKTGTGTKDGHKFETQAWTVLSFRHGQNQKVMTVFVEKGSGGKEAKSLVSKILYKISEANESER